MGWSQDPKQMRKSIVLVILLSLSSLLAGAQDVVFINGFEARTADISGLFLSVDSEESNLISVVAGERSDHRIFFSKSDPTIVESLTIEPATNGINIIYEGDDPYLAVDASVLPAGTTTAITVVATNEGNGLQERVDVTVDVLELTVAVSGTMRVSGSVLSTPGGLIGIKIGEDELVRNVTATIRAALTSNGDAIFRVEFNEDISNALGKLSLISNENAVDLDYFGLKAFQKSAALTAMQASDSMLGNTIHKFHGFYAGKFRLDPSEKTLADWSTSCEMLTVGPTPIGNGRTICARRLSDAAVLSSANTIDYIKTLTETKEVVPVLFINGFLIRNRLGGGEGTWGEFSTRVQQLSDQETEYMPFEFQWRTNSSFNVVANDLKAAITRIYRITGRPVRIIAHSFGGLLVRTLLQHDSSIDTRYVRSVLTLGTPHSGLFEDKTVGAKYNQIFPDGQDSLIWACRQISCYQAGESVSFGDSLKNLTAAGEWGELIEDLEHFAYPDVPTVVGIGLKREDGFNDKYDEGDGLITYLGQRFLTNIWVNRDEGLEPIPLLKCDPSVELYVSEFLLGAGSLDLRPGDEVVDDAKGYSHSTLLTTDPDNRLEHHEAKIENDNNPHDSFERFRNMVDTNSSAFDSCEPPDFQPPDIAPTMMGTTVSVAINWPNLGDIATIPFATIVSNSLEFPSDIYQDADTGDSVSPIRKNSNIGADFIDIQFMQTARADSTSFNGDVYDLLGEDSPTIIGAALDTTLSTFSDIEVLIDFDEDSVFVNFSDARIEDGDRIYVNLVLENPGGPIMPVTATAPP